MFTIITPTYKRSEHVKRAIVSVQKQTHPLYTMIIVNDSPDDTSYDSVKDICENDPRITYLENEKNMGVNFSRNRALDVCADDTWVIFLDDDDELAPDALSHFAQLIDHHPHGHWFMANRALVNGASLTRAPKANMYYSYAFDYLITKRITGDATHCIYKKSIGEKRFSTYIKQGEEWLFFFQLGTQEELFYASHNSTLSHGYDMHQGLNFRPRPKMEQLRTLCLLYKEAYAKKLYWHFLLYVYLQMRLVRILIK